MIDKTTRQKGVINIIGDKLDSYIPPAKHIKNWIERELKDGGALSENSKIIETDDKRLLRTECLNFIKSVEGSLSAISAIKALCQKEGVNSLQGSSKKVT